MVHVTLMDIFVITSHLSQLQTIMQDYFVMIMMVEVPSGEKIADIAPRLDELGNEIGVSVRIQHEDIFNMMHRI